MFFHCCFFHLLYAVVDYVADRIGICSIYIYIYIIYVELSKIIQHLQ